MRVRFLIAAWIVSAVCAGPAAAQFKKADPEGAELGEAQTVRIQCGVTVRAGTVCRGIVAYTAVPMDWPEQEVRIVEEDVSPSAKVSYSTIGGMAKCMEVRIASMQPGEEVNALVTFEVRRSSLVPPEKTDGFVVPDAKKLDARLRTFLAPSPKIESRDRKIRSLAKEIVGEEKGAWTQVELIYDWVRDHVEYKNGPLKGALAALKDKTGDCEELTSLFIALCRASDIPARTVWVEGHCYPEFYLMDDQGQGHWFPCQAAGSRAFGGIPEFRPVLQKGDSIRPPYSRREQQRYLANNLTGTGGRPQVRFVRKVVGQ